jgi:electron transfer flavoprotein-quinone oxidoreductase
MFAGFPSDGRVGGGFLYTNKNSISLGVVCTLSELTKGQKTVPQLLEDFKAHPAVAPLIKGGRLLEYSGHLVPEGGLSMMPGLIGNGVLVAGDAAGFSLNIGLTVRGMEYALGSGYYAAQAVLKAKEAGDFSARGLSVYENILNDSFVMKDFRAFKDAPEALDNERLFTHYPEFAGSIMKELYEVPAGPKKPLYRTVRQHISFGEMWAMFNDYRKVKRI